MEEVSAWEQEKYIQDKRVVSVPKLMGFLNDVRKEIQEKKDLQALPSSLKNIAWLNKTMMARKLRYLKIGSVAKMLKLKNAVGADDKLWLYIIN